VRSYSPATLIHYRQGLGVLFRFLAGCGIGDVREMTREVVGRYHQWLLERGWKTRTLHSWLMALRRFCEHLERTDAILINPCLGLALPRLENRLPRRVLSRQEARRILDQPDTQTGRGIRDKAILELFYSTGLRRQEMARLTVHDVDWLNGFLRVNRGKGGRDRIAPMGRKACDYTREYLQKVRSQWSKANRDERALWLGSKSPHKPLGVGMIEQLVQVYGRQGIGRAVSPHVWRHTCATHLVAGGAPIAHVQRLLGHRSLRTTQIYTRVSVPDLRRMHRRHHPRA